MSKKQNYLFSLLGFLLSIGFFLTISCNEKGKLSDEKVYSKGKNIDTLSLYLYYPDTFRSNQLQLLGKMKRLKYISLTLSHDVKLIDLFKMLPKNLNLKSLVLSINQDSVEIPLKDIRMRSIREFGLHSKTFKLISSELDLSGWDSIQFLRFSSNNIENFTYKLPKKRIEELSLGFTLQKSPIIYNYLELITLDLSYNKIEDLKEIQNLKQVNEVLLCENPVAQKYKQNDSNTISSLSKQNPVRFIFFKKMDFK